MTTNAVRLASGYDQPDIASMQVGDVLYRLDVYRVAGRVGTGINTAGLQLRARCYVEQAHEQDVLLFDSLIAEADVDAGTGYAECPKVIAVGTTFVVVWCENDTVASRALGMASLDMSTIATTGPVWDDAGREPTHDSALFDICRIQNATYFGGRDDSFILVHRIDTDEINVRRVDGFDWVSTDWSTNYTTPDDIADRILTVYCYEGLLEPFVLVGYQSDFADTHHSGVVHVARFTSTNGVNTGDETLFAEQVGEDVGIVVGCAAFERVSQGRAALVLEYFRLVDLDNDDRVPHLGYVLVDATTLDAASSAHVCPNVSMLSRPFALPGQSDIATPTARLYCVVGFKSVTAINDDGAGGEWDQAYAYVVDLDWTRWDDVADPVPGATWVRPYVVSVLNQNIVDARISAYVGFPGVGPSIDTIFATTVDGRRTNHPSHVTDPPDFGPGVKSSTIAIAGFSQFIQVGQSTSQITVSGSKPLPFGARVWNWEYHYEDPWVVWRDAREQPIANWAGAHPLPQHESVAVGRHLLIGGGCPSVYDGHQTHELGYPWAPEIVDIGVTDRIGSNNLTAGVYYYVAVYEWTDDTGNRHRSPPSLPFGVTLADSVDHQFTIRVRTQTLSLKDNRVVYPDAARMQIVIYRTLSDQLQFYRLFCLDNGGFASAFTVQNTPANDPDTWYVEFDDYLPDDTLLAVGDVLPWPILDASGVATELLPEPVPAACVLAVWQERVWLAQIEDPDVVSYSKALQRGVAPEFSSVNTVRRDNLGPVTAMVAKAQEMVVFSRDRIYSIVGRVNNDAGTDGDLTINLITDGLGCVCARSVALTPVGIVFQSRKGLYVTDGGQTRFIGDAVMDYVRDAGSIRAVHVLEERHQIRVVCNALAEQDDADEAVVAPVELLYDYRADMWSRVLPLTIDSTARDAEAQDACVWRGHEGETSHVLLQQGGVSVERASDDTPFADHNGSADVAMPIVLQTGRIKVAGFGGVERVRSVLVTLERPNGAQLTILLEFDTTGSGEYDQTQTAIFAAGTASPLRVQTRVQKFVAFRVRIAETGSVPTGDTLRITGLTLVAGVKKGHAKLPVAQVR